MFCEHCGKEIKDNAIFCKYCGVSVTEKTDVNQPQTADIISPYIQKEKKIWDTGCETGNNTNYAYYRLYIFIFLSR